MRFLRWKIGVYLLKSEDLEMVAIPTQLVDRVIERNRNKNCSGTSLLGKLCKAIGDNFEECAK